MKIPIESFQKKLSIVLTYTERLTVVFFQKNHENLFNLKKTVLSVSRSLQLTTFQTWISHENINRIIQKKSAYSVYVYGALDVRLFPNNHLNVDLKNIEIWVSHGLKTKKFSSNHEIAVSIVRNITLIQRNIFCFDQRNFKTKNISFIEKNGFLQ